MKFCVVALPRSRTAWLAAWLGVEHEPLSRLSSLGALPEGVVDTAAALFFPALWARWPQARYLFVFRPLDEIAQSSRAAGLDTRGLALLAQAQRDGFAQVEHAPNVMAVRFEQLSSLGTLRAVWAHLVGTRFDAERAARMVEQNIQADVAEILSRADPARMQQLLTEA